MKQLIVAVDDFGLAKSINEGVAMACREGIATVANLMPAGEAFDDAVRTLKELGMGEAGGHLALTEVSPVTAPAEVPTLVGPDGKFPGGYPGFFARLLLGRINRDEIYKELKNQLERLKDSGVRITCLSSHEHIHMMPALLDIFLALAKEYGIPAIRYLNETQSFLFSPPLSLKRLYRLCALRFLGGSVRRKIDGSGLLYPGRTIGFLDSGRMTEETLLRSLGSLPDGTTELIMHPGFLSPEVLSRYGFHSNCEAELHALVSRRVKKVIKDRDIKLVGYAELLSKKP